MEPDFPYCGPAPDPQAWLMAWNLDPVLLTCLGGAAWAGVWLLRGQGPMRQRAFAVAVFAAVLAFVSPLCAMTVALFSARTLHHLVVIAVLAPALAMAFPWRRGPQALAFLGLSAALWLWHLPVVYSAAWDSAAVYWGLQMALILPGWAFWSAVLGKQGRGSVPGLVWLVSLVGQMGVLGALLTFAPRAFYAEHLAHAPRFGLNALEDQQLAGLIMWVPGMVPLAVLAAIIAWRTLWQGARV
ncbi:cytochrome c oxidase assembly protein [Roseinatronobacter alkalisoli]|uniref:Cytochrome c oxidase assembly protein n=1 Tax=Roseinatronobacter alkalisoli TaxID=3028235 RepID=A0ABT5T898_9RHOB|nr:cytochrome c oxidase assembly protein [Roseinatronobacter sp. HJB301]MDD7971353.1 cytochrome c oxidase assembly protein [Roseinatronobacter sp. HJB301]